MTAPLDISPEAVASLAARFEAACQKLTGDTAPNAVADTMRALRSALTASEEQLAELKERVTDAVTLAVRYGGTDGGHHKAWVIDQMVRQLMQDGYQQLVAEAKAGEDGPDTYSWDEGIAP